MCDKPQYKRAKLSDETPAAETCCRTLDEAMVATHPSCLQSHLAAQEPGDDTFNGYMVWLHAESRRGNISCTECVKVSPQVWLRSPWPWYRDLEALIRAGCSSCVKYLISTMGSTQQRDFLKHTARIVVRGGSMLVAEIYSIASDSSDGLVPQNFVKVLFTEAAYAHLMPAQKQQPATAVTVNEMRFDFVADLITKLVAASADLTDVLTAALTAMLEVSCADGIRWLRQQYCTTENTAAVIDGALRQCQAHDRYRNLDVAPLSADSLEALLEAGEADRVLRVDSMWWQSRHEWLARRGPIEHHEQCCESAQVIMSAAGAGAESLLVGAPGDGLLYDAIRTSNEQQLTVLLSDTALTQAVLTAKCSEEATALHYVVKLCCDSSCSAEHTPAGIRACIEVIVKATHDANCLHDVLSVQDAAGITAATWLLRVGFKDFVALLPADSSLKVKIAYELSSHVHHCDRKALGQQ
jgi:hypothetical protein